MNIDKKWVHRLVLCGALFGASTLQAGYLWQNGGNQIPSSSGGQSNVKILPGPAPEETYMVWLTTESGNADIKVARVNASGVRQWTRDVTGGLSSNQGLYGSDYPYFSAIKMGNDLVVYWIDDRNTGRGLDAYAQRVSADGSIALNWAAAGMLISSGTGASNARDQWPVLVPSGADGMLLFYMDYSTSPDVDPIYAKRINLADGLSDTLNWTVGDVLITSPTATAIGSMSAAVESTNGSGLITWSEKNSGTSGYDLFAARISTGGYKVFTATVVCNAVGDQGGNDLQDDGLLAAISNNNNGMYVVWVDTRSSSNGMDIYATQIEADGSRTTGGSWVANGNVICSTVGVQRNMVLAYDSLGSSLMVAWEDSRVTALPRVFLQKISSAGSVQFSANGIDVASPMGQQSQPALGVESYTQDPFYFVAFKSRRQINSVWEEDVYVQRLDAAGTKMFGPAAEAVAPSAASMSQRKPAIYSGSGSDSAIVAWEDGSTIRAQRMVPVGLSGTVYYSGTQGESMNVIVCVSTLGPSMIGNQNVYLDATIDAGPGAFSFNEQNGFIAGNYWIMAYRDLNANSVFDAGEPQGAFNSFSAGSAEFLSMPVSVSSGITSMAIILRDFVAINGEVTRETTDGGYLVLEATGAGGLLFQTRPFANNEPDYGVPTSYTFYVATSPTDYGLRAYVDTANNGQGNNYWDECCDPYTVTTVAVGNTGANDVTLTVSGESSGGGTTGGTAEYFSMNDYYGGTYQYLGVNTVSNELRVYLRDYYWNPTTSSQPVVVQLQALRNDWETADAGAAFSPNSSFSTVITSITIPAGQPYASFWFRTATVDYIHVRGTANDFPVSGDSRTAYYDFNIAPAGTGFSGVYASPTTITPDNDQVDDFTAIHFTPPQNQGWDVMISTDPGFGNYVYFMSGWGQWPEGAIWNGRDTQWRVVPNGTYYVRLQTSGGGLKNDTLQIQVQSSYIRGKVVNGSSVGQSDVYINYWGQNEGGSVETDSAGNFSIYGLKAGQYYGMNLNKEGLAGRQINNIQAPANLPNITMAQGVTLRLAATVNKEPEGWDAWGNVFAHDANYENTTNGSFRIRYGTTVSDNGFWEGDPSYSTWTTLGIMPDTAYTLEANIYGYGTITKTIAPQSAGATVDVPVFAFTRKTNLYGKVSVPTSRTEGLWVSVDATKRGETSPSAWGGTWVDCTEVHSNVYTLFGLDPGVYTLRAFAQGYKSQTLSNITVGTEDLGDKYFGGAAATPSHPEIDFPEFVEGGKVNGTLRVIGNSSSLSNEYGGGFSVYLNAWSPTTYQGCGIQVNLSTSSTETSSSFSITGLDDGTYYVHSWLQGFQMDPPGMKQVTVSNGTGQLDVTFKALSGSIAMTVQLPAGYSDYNNVTFMVYGGEGYSGTVQGTGQTTTLSGLGTGMYSIEAIYLTTGFHKKTAVPVINGETAAVSIGLGENTFAISGTIAMQGNINLSPVYNVTVSSVAGLQAKDPSAPKVQIYKFPLPDSSYSTVEPYAKATATISGTGATFGLTGFPPGTYLVKVKNDLNPPSPPTYCSECMSEDPAYPEFASTNDVVYITNANVSDVALTLSNGVELAGTIRRPVGDTTVDSRQFDIILRRTDNLAVWRTTVTSSGSNTSYNFKHISAGDYTLQVKEKASGTGVIPKYHAAPAFISIANADVTKNITLVKAGTVVGKLRDVDSNTLITSNNYSQFLGSNFNLNANANPWTEGGWSEALRGNQGQIYISTTTGQFYIPRLMPGTSYDIGLQEYQSMDAESIAKGQKSYAPTVKSGIRVADGQTVDIGVLDLKQGVQISGQVKDLAGNPLSNIRIIGNPSLSEQQWQLQVEGYTDADGRYTLNGVDRDQRYYDVTASPRYRPGETYYGLLSGGKTYGEENRLMIDLSDSVKMTNVDFTLTEANGVLMGKVVTADGGDLLEPFDNKGGMKAKQARIVLKDDNDFMVSDNPMGNIEEITDPNGNFRVTALKPGSYTLRVVSFGYIIHKQKIIVRSGDNDVGTVTLERGATASGTIRNQDGSKPSTTDVSFVAAGDSDFEEIVIGQIISDEATQLVTGYELPGFKPNVEYTILLMNKGDDMTEAYSGLTFTSAAQKKTVNLIYRPAAPVVYATVKKTGTNVYSLRFLSSQKLRNLTTDDNDLEKIITLASGNGQLSNKEMTPSRDMLTATYEMASTDKTFEVRLRFKTIVVNPDSASKEPYEYDNTFKFYKGVGRERRIRIANTMGGRALLEGDPTGSLFSPGSFDVAGSSRVEVGVRMADSLDDLTLASPKRGYGAVKVATSLGPLAYPEDGELYKAVRLASTPQVDPFSSFYDIFLPAGIRHSLKKDAKITLKYDDSVTDPSALNVYFFDTNNNVFLLEAKNRKVDSVNKTVTVGVSHASTFVILASSASIIGASSYTGTEIILYNFPNPFDLKNKTVTLANPGSSAASQTIEGTMIRAAIPWGITGTMKFEIYNIAGELVRTLTAEAPNGGTYYYITWDGKNDGGGKVASGVYIARFTIGGHHPRFFKMAVLK
ncbi:MAG TPA: FlgD immunoglobulin-like domain containing protein [Elusimicrobiota bacterium]|nr:FlgD immunoglobulin-like domain containing protein [Elusimicrobiota bacterium]